MESRRALRRHRTGGRHLEAAGHPHHPGRDQRCHGRVDRLLRSAPVGHHHHPRNGHERGRVPDPGRGAAQLRPDGLRLRGRRSSSRSRDQARRIGDSAVVGSRVIRPGIAVVAQPMPGHSLVASNCYVIATDDGAVVIDPGYERPDTLARIAVGLAAVGRGLRDVHTVALTHSHRDHAEAVDLIRERVGATVALHAADRVTSITRVGSGDAAPGSQVPEHWGVPPPMRARLLARPAPHVVRADVDLEPGWCVAGAGGG
ncbi:MAG: MBL fold metallo-hydrolase, partial [Microbacterium sp.]